MKQTVVWSIAGSDSSGYAGIAADIKTFNMLGVHGCTVISAVTAQNRQQLTDIQFVAIEPQLMALQQHHIPAAIKIGMLGNISVIEVLRQFLERYRGIVVLDPVLITTSGGSLFTDNLCDYIAVLKTLFRFVDVLTPNIPELEKILNCSIQSYADMVEGAQQLLSLGVKSVLVKGGHLQQGLFSQDYWTNGKESFWLVSRRFQDQTFSGTGCTLSAAIAATCALHYEIKDALVVAKMVVNQAIRESQIVTSDAQGRQALVYNGWPEDETDLPYVTNQPLTMTPRSFLTCGAPIGLYPLIDSLEWLQILHAAGVKTVQLRIKDKMGIELERIIKNAIEFAKDNDIRLFINDHWKLAIQYHAYGVHLGQDDLHDADIDMILKNGLRLGISTHGYYEIARAHAFHPSYIAFGPIFTTKSKVTSTTPHGIAKLKDMGRLLNYPLVAIGGIDATKIDAILEARINGVAIISGITHAKDPLLTTKKLVHQVNDHASWNG